MLTVDKLLAINLFSLSLQLQSISNKVTLLKKRRYELQCEIMFFLTLWAQQTFRSACASAQYDNVHWALFVLTKVCLLVIPPVYLWFKNPVYLFIKVFKVNPGEKVNEISLKYHQSSTEISPKFHRKSTDKFGQYSNRISSEYHRNSTEILPKFHRNSTEISQKYHHNFIEISP